MGYENRARVSYILYDEIPPKIASKELDSYDIVYTTDTHENILISPDLNLIPVNYRVYRFNSVDVAEEFLNYSSDTYNGQLVSILFNGHYSAYIVNEDEHDRFYVTPLNQYSGEIDYNVLRNRPVSNLMGTLDSPIVISELDAGIYTIKGQYKISPTAETTYLSNNNNIFIIERENDSCHIKKITSKDIINYSVSTVDDTISVSSIPTTDYLLEQGYASVEYVDTRVAAMNFLTRDEVDTYVAQVIADTIDGLIDERIDVKIDEKLSTAAATDDMILKLFEQKERRA